MTRAPITNCSRRGCGSRERENNTTPCSLGVARQSRVRQAERTEDPSAASGLPLTGASTPGPVEWGVERAFRTAEEAPIADLTDGVLAAAGSRAEQERLLWRHFYPLVFAALCEQALEYEAHLRDRLLHLPWTRLLEAMRNRNLVAPLLLEAGVPFEHIYRSWWPAVPLTPGSGDSDASSGGPVGEQAGPSDELALQPAGETPGAEMGAECRAA